MTKTAVITGATTGIGAAFARRLAADGYNLVITGRRKEIIGKLADDLSKQHGVTVDLVIAELSDDKDFQKLVDVVKKKDDIEMLINNAGYSGYNKHFAELDPTEYEKMVKVHELVPMKLISLVVPGMIKRKSGTIINVSSIAGIMPMPSISVYCATKAFLKSYSLSLYQELKDKGVTVQVLCPGVTRTDFGKNLWSKDIYEAGYGEDKKIMSAEKVVDYSFKYLKKDKPVCIPGFSNSMLSAFFPSLPMGMYNSMRAKMTPFK
jgi:uncharacterized protein